MIITIDGPAGSGKSTLAKNLAARLGFIYLDTGATYRAIALAAKRGNIDESHPAELATLPEHNSVELVGGPKELRVLLNGEDVTDEIRSAEISDLTSRISTVSGLRRALVALQRRLARGRDVVSEGRDTGTVVFPDADIKIYLDASIGERAIRRADDWDEGASIEEIMYDIAIRDDRDRTRADSPLRVAEGAVIIDSTSNTKEETLEAATSIMRGMGLIP